MDGVLYHGEQALPGAARFLAAIADLPHAFVTNNPIRTPEQIAARFLRLGLPRPDPSQIVTSAQATACWLAREIPGYRYYAVGAGGLHAALAEFGSADRERADVVVIGEGPGLDYDSLTHGVNLICGRGARLLATNPDLTVDDSHDGRHRLLPGGGALVAPFAAAAGVQPVVIGKPEPLLFRMALERLSVPASACVMIGDRPDTDIAGAARLGLLTALVRTGRFAPGDSWPEDVPRPDWDVEDLDTLCDRLGIFPRTSCLPRCRPRPLTTQEHTHEICHLPVVRIPVRSPARPGRTAAGTTGAQWYRIPRRLPELAVDLDLRPD